jgi:hypothetical protein
MEEGDHVAAACVIPEAAVVPPDDESKPNGQGDIKLQ